MPPGHSNGELSSLYKQVGQLLKDNRITQMKSNKHKISTSANKILGHSRSLKVYYSIQQNVIHIRPNIDQTKSHFQMSLAVIDSSSFLNVI